jgi:hypothetical protein
VINGATLCLFISVMSMFSVMCIILMIFVIFTLPIF